ncbi:MAG: division/cell wall cluster transcriptional repressor MraZ [Candidatus Promineifilaceae bacterium]
MFIGEYSHTVDEKGRLTIPARYRGELAAGLVVTRGFDQYLMVYPVEGWKVLAEDVAARPTSDEGVRAFQRRLFSGAVDLTPDRQGRVVLPAFLRNFASINGEVVVAGMYSHIEVWNAEAWAGVKGNIESNNDVARWSALGV